MVDSKSFPNPHDLETIPGTEGWERMYPYQYEFTTDDPERKKYEEDTFWFYDGLHYPEPLYPFDAIWDEAWFLALSQYSHRIFSIPPVMGVDHRMMNGYVYISPVPVTDPEEVGARVPDFLERAGYYYENWDELEAKWVTKMEATIAELADKRVPTLPVLEDISVVKEALGQSSGYHLLKAYDEVIDLGIRCWQYHFEFLNLGYAAYVTFMGHCQKLWPDIPMQRITQMISGIDVIMYRPDDELKKLAGKAIELKVADTLCTSSSFETVAVELAKTSTGKAWLEALEDARYPWFHVSTGTGWFHHDRSWNDDLDVPLNAICTYIDKLKSGANIDRPIAEIGAERDRITKEYRDLIATDEDRDAFDQLLGVAKTVFPYVENHLFYVEHWFHSIFWNKIREFAVIMHEHGFINDVEDIWLLKKSEIKDALWDLTTAWASGTKPRGPLVWPKEISWRKGVMKKFQDWTPPPAFGPVPEVIQEPFTVVLWGVTNDSLANWTDVADNDNVSSFKGFAASPGMVEGPARVCRTVKEIGQLKEGEILVAPTTSPSWAPAFIKIKACVTDVGGVMSHAAIVCREYAMPAVVGTGAGTKIVKTGDMIRVNGSTGEVELI